MTTIENTIDPDKRFAKHQGREYHVFSTHKSDPAGVEKWVGLSRPKWVLMDPDTYFSIRNQRIEWVFGDEGTLQSVKIIDTSSGGETKGGKPPLPPPAPVNTPVVTEEIEEEEPSGSVVEEKPPLPPPAPVKTPTVDEEIEEEASLPDLVPAVADVKKPPPKSSVPIKTPELVPKPAPIPMTTPDLAPANTPEIVPAIAPRSTVVHMPDIVKKEDAARAAAAVTSSMCELKL